MRKIRFPGCKKNRIWTKKADFYGSTYGAVCAYAIRICIFLWKMRESNKESGIIVLLVIK